MCFNGDIVDGDGDGDGRGEIIYDDKVYRTIDDIDDDRG